MKTSNFVGALMAVAIVGGGALALEKSGENTVVSAREAVCANILLEAAERENCSKQMKDAKSEVAKQQIATCFQSKIDIRDATNYGTKSSSGGASKTSATPSNDAPMKAPAETKTPDAPKK